MGDNSLDSPSLWMGVCDMSDTSDMRDMCDGVYVSETSSVLTILLHPSAIQCRSSEKKRHLSVLRTASESAVSLIPIRTYTRTPSGFGVAL
jgi:hypothetical protein